MRRFAWCYLPPLAMLAIFVLHSRGIAQLEPGEYVPYHLRQGVELSWLFSQPTAALVIPGLLLVGLWLDRLTSGKRLRADQRGIRLLLRLGAGALLVLCARIIWTFATEAHDPQATPARLFLPAVLIVMALVDSGDWTGRRVQLIVPVAATALFCVASLEYRKGHLEFDTARTELMSDAAGAESVGFDLSYGYQAPPIIADGISLHLPPLAVTMLAAAAIFRGPSPLWWIS